MIPTDVRYTREHEWVKEVSEGTLRVGITDFAQEALGDIVYVDLPEVGEAVEAGSSMGELESTKSVSDLYAPVTGTVTARNEKLQSAPELCNTDAYGEGWIVEIAPADDAELQGLLSAQDYEATITSS
ncbi:MAG: glycine cleavage system protein GcvH [Nocardioidaceae bacterium]|nr:glycine cleavage system protein GcvH [Nocardioidaceae bacterium]